ncbi:hypothetical protein NQ315_009851 [Exocentrus adspersus]|uniref:Uncharacterized protein n=1 Tax=Exocentrus adspersus TaxID=1586481 RepID=A0AAV8WHR8_9CUCU|nr:hypothetical protein NQ315_009851 [Exocentrus adspersus]
MSAEQERALREAAVAVGVFGPPVSLTMALTPARYSNSFLPHVSHSSLPNREPTPTKDNSDNDGMYVLHNEKSFIACKIMEQ